MTCVLFPCQKHKLKSRQQTESGFSSCSIASARSLLMQWKKTRNDSRDRRRLRGPFLFQILCLLGIISLALKLVSTHSDGIYHLAQQILEDFDAANAHRIHMSCKPDMDPRVRRLHIAREDHFVHSVQGTYPRLCRLSDGSILAGFTSFLPGGQRALTIVRSTDEARTFQPHGEVTRSFNDCDNLFLLELPPKAGAGTSTILAAFRNHDLDRNGAHTYFRITVCRSTDGGRTWSFLSQAFEKPAPFGLWEPFLRMGADGREVQLYFSMELAMNDQDTMLVHSPDGGATWTTPRRVTGGGEALRDGMVGLAEARDCERGSGALVLVMETTRLGTFSVEAVVSFDDGHTFGCRQVVYAARKGRNAGAPQIAAFADGSVAVVFMTDEDEYSEPKWPRGAKIKAVFGTLMADGKLLWNPAQVVGDAMCSWPGIMRIADDAAVAVYETSASIRGRILRVGT